MDRQTLKLLWDILEHAREIETMTAGVSFDEYEKDRKLLLAVERCFEIIGIALNEVKKLRSDIAISDSEKIIGMRNKIAHGYDEIEHVNVWNAIKKNLPILIKEVEALLNVKK